MLYQELPRIESTPLDGWGRSLAPALIFGAALSATLVLLLLGRPLLGGAAALVGAAGAALTYARAPGKKTPSEPLIVGPDYSLLGSALSLTREPAALTTGEGSLLIVNTGYRERFGGRPPLELGIDDDSIQALGVAFSMARRDGAGCVTGVDTVAGGSPVEVERVGTNGEFLLWRLP